MSSKVYIVMRSNCEQWEDYHEWVDSAWSWRVDAVRHIEENLGMMQCDFAVPDREWSRDRWSRTDVMYATREDYGSDAEWQRELDESGGEPPVVWEDEDDAWIVELPVFGRLDEWKERHEEEQRAAGAR